MFTLKATNTELNNWEIYLRNGYIGKFWRMPSEDKWAVEVGVGHEPVIIEQLEDLMLYLTTCAIEYNNNGCAVILIDTPDNNTKVALPKDILVTGVFCRIDGQYFVTVEASWLPKAVTESGDPTTIFESVAKLEEYRAQAVS